MRRAGLDADQMPPEGAAGRRMRLPKEVGHYLRDVLRMDPDQRVELFDGTGRVLVARIVSINTDRVRVRIDKDHHIDRAESPCAITLIQAIPKGKRWKMVLQKATELGVSRFIPLETSRTVVHISDAKVDRKRNRWQRVIAAAVRQCKRTIAPDITAPMSLAEAVEQVADMPSFVAHAVGDPPSLSAAFEHRGLLDAPPASLAVWIGPEGGFDRQEVAKLDQAGATTFHMGPRVLRAETAGIAAVCLLQAFVGDLS